MARKSTFLRLGLLATLLVGCAADEGEQVKKAKAYFENNDIKSTIIVLKDVLSSNGDNVEARELMGKAYYKVGDFPYAIKEFTIAKELGASNPEVMPSLAKSLFFQAKYQDITELVWDTPSQDFGPIEFRCYQALAYVELDDITSANNRLEATDSSLAVSSCRLLVQAAQAVSEGYLDIAEAKYKAAIQTELFADLAWSGLGDVYYLRDDDTLSEAAYTQALDVFPHRATDRLKRLSLRVKLGDYDGALDDIQIVEGLYSKQPITYFNRGLIKIRKGDWASSEADFQKSVSVDKTFNPARFYLAMIHQKLGNDGQARDYAEEFVSAYPDDQAGMKLLLSVKVDNNDFSGLDEIVDDLKSIDGYDDESIRLIAGSLFKQRKYHAAKILIEQLIEKTPGSDELLFQLGVVELKLENDEAGVSRLKESLSVNDRYQQSYLALCFYYLQREEVGLALDVARTFQEKFPESVVPDNLLGKIYLSSKQYDLAESSLRRVLSVSPADVSANINLANMAITKKDYVSAREHYTTILKNNSEHYQSIMGMVSLSLIENNAGEVEEWLDNAISSHPDLLPPRLMLARYYVATGRSSGVASVFLGLPKQYSLNEQVLELKALAAIEDKQYESAKFYLESWVLQGDNATAYSLMSRVNAGMNDAKSMQDNLERSVELDGNNSSTRLALARLLLVQGDVEAANTHIDYLNENYPNADSVKKLLAFKDQRSGNTLQAESRLLDVYSDNPSSTNLISLSLHKLTAGKKSEAIELLESWQGDSDDVSLLLASVYGKNNETDQAIKKYRLLLEKDKDNHVVLNELAWLLRERKPQEALVYAKHAADIRPDTIQIMDTLAVVYLKNNMLDKAKETIDSIISSSPNNVYYRYHGALIDAALGDKSGAIKSIEQILGSNVEFSEKAEAKMVLANLKSGSS